jgi:hypothetical protein
MLGSLFETRSSRSEIRKRMLSVFFIFRHLLYDWVLSWIIVGLLLIILHRHHLLLLILLLHNIRILVSIVLILIYHLVLVVHKLLGCLHVIIIGVLLRELEMTTRISRGERLHR